MREEVEVVEKQEWLLMGKCPEEEFLVQDGV